jgi:hypothetical protein
MTQAIKAIQRVMMLSTKRFRIKRAPRLINRHASRVTGVIGIAINVNLTPDRLHVFNAFRAKATRTGTTSA